MGHTQAARRAVPGAGVKRHATPARYAGLRCPAPPSSLDPSSPYRTKKSNLASVFGLSIHHDKLTKFTDDASGSRSPPPPPPSAAGMAPVGHPSQRLARLAQHVLAQRAAPTPSAASADDDTLALRPVHGLTTADFVQGSAGNTQTEEGIVLSEEERAVGALVAAMEAGIEDFDTVRPLVSPPPRPPAPPPAAVSQAPTAGCWLLRQPGAGSWSRRAPEAPPLQAHATAWAGAALLGGRGRAAAGAGTGPLARGWSRAAPGLDQGRHPRAPGGRHCAAGAAGRSA
eukprot:COSAG04_NODE_387_length_15288_cov_17.787609_3_plen_285_part_00